MFVRLIKSLSLAVLMSHMLGCGGGSSTNGSIAITAPATVTAGKSFQATATVTSAAGIAAIPVSFSSSDPTIIPNSTADTSAGGVATAQLSAANIINADKDVTITAQAGGLTSSTKVTVRANRLTFNAPTAGAVTATAGATVSFFFSGSPLITYTDADGQSLGIKDITLKVFSKTPQVANVFWHDNLTDTTYLANNPRTFKTDTLGSLPNSVVSVDGIAPAATLVSQGSVTLEISVSDPGFGTILKYGDIPFSITGQ